VAGGADLIDVKEPAHGPLGRAAATTVAAVVRAVAGRRPVSAALGELLRQPKALRVTGVHYVKWGLAGYGTRRVRDWRDDLEAAVERVRRQDAACRVVPVAYADWQAAEAPPVDEVTAFVGRRPGGVFLVDTWVKGNGRTLVDWLDVAYLARLCRRCRAAGVRVALAGSLGAAQVRQVLPLRPDWIAVRGAACQQDDRSQAVHADRVRALARLIADFTAATVSS
jgi:uncharacterized protein (UPF0264 family)